MAGPAAAAAPVYVGGAALLAGAVYLMTPQGQRATESLGEAMGQGASNAWDNVTGLFGGEEETQAPPVPATGAQTDTMTQPCDGPHRGRFQAQGYNRRVDPAPVELSAPWNKGCIPPLKPEGFHLISNVLLVQTRLFSHASAGLRAPAFAKMSKHVKSAPPIEFLAGHNIGFGITPNGRVKINIRSGASAPRVDLEVKVGRAFGTK